MTRKALWVGGPPGQTMIKISQRLREQLDIEVIDQIEGVRKIKTISPIVELVLINHEMVGHGLAQSAVDEAKKRGIPFCYSAISTTLTRRNLEIKGLVEARPKPTPPPAPDPEPVVEEEPEPEEDHFGPTGEGWTMFEEKGVVYILKPDGKRQQRRCRPILVGELVYASQSEAAEDFEVHPSVITKALTAGAYKDLPIGLPRTEEVLAAFPAISVAPDLLGITPPVKPVSDANPPEPAPPPQPVPEPVEAPEPVIEVVEPDLDPTAGPDAVMRRVLRLLKDGPGGLRQNLRAAEAFLARVQGDK